MRRVLISAAVRGPGCLVLCSLALFLSPARLPGAERVIGAASSMVTFFPDTPPAPGELAEEMTLSAARGECESAQVVIASGDRALDIQRVEASDLQCGAERIGSASIDVRLVAYVEIKEGENSWRGIRRPGLWPDPLLPLRPFTCPAGECRLLWVTVKVPETATPGQYEGQIRLYSAAAQEASLPVRLTVWNFSLPKAPRMQTSYWTHIETAYDFAVEPEIFLQTIRLFGEYRTSTDLWPSWDFRDPKTLREWVVLWYLEPDGSITCDISGLQRTVEAAVEAGFSTLQIGHGCWMGDEFHDMSLIDRATGRLLKVRDETRESALRRAREAVPAREREGFPGTFFARLFLKPMCDWLDSRGLLDSSYMQLYDESVNPASFPDIARLYQRYRLAEPRLKLLGLTTVHPFMSGVYDIWSPDALLYDPETYDMVRRGVSLRGPKNFRAVATASSSGGWSSEHIDYQPADACDGCDYTKWKPAAAPSAEIPQWIRFDFEDSSGGVDGLRIVPFPYLPWDTAPTDTVWVVEASLDGHSFGAVDLTPRTGVEGACSFTLQPYKAVRLTHAKVGSRFAPAAPQATLAMNAASNMRRTDGATYISAAEGIREVEFLRAGIPLEATRARERVRPAEMWEYQFGAGYPSVCVDTDPAEMRAHGWQCWARGLRGYLNAGGGGQSWQPQSRPGSEDPLVWNLQRLGWAADPGSQWIVYPGQAEVLPSVRLARFRDGVDDYDCLAMLAGKQPDHPVLAQLRAGAREPYAFTLRWAGGGPEPYGGVESMLKARAAVAESLDKLGSEAEEP